MAYYTYILNQIQIDNPIEAKWGIQYITTIDAKNFESQFLNVNLESPNSLYYLLCKALLDTLNTENTESSNTSILMTNVNALNTKDITQKVLDMYTSYYTRIMNFTKEQQESNKARIGMIKDTIETLQTLYSSFDDMVYSHRDTTPVEPMSKLPVSHYFVFSSKKLPFHTMEQMNLYHPETKELLHFVDNQPNTYETIQPKVDTIKQKMEGLIQLTEQFDVFSNEHDVKESDNILSNTFNNVSIQKCIDEEVSDVIPYNEYMSPYLLNDYETVYKNPFEGIEEELMKSFKDRPTTADNKLGFDINPDFNEIIINKHKANKADIIDFEKTYSLKDTYDYDSERNFLKLKKLRRKHDDNSLEESTDSSEHNEYLFAIYGQYDKKTTIVSDFMILQSSLESVFTCPQLQKLFNIRVYKFKPAAKHKTVSLFSDLVKNTVYDTFTCMCEDIDTFNNTDTITESFLEEFMKKNYILDNNKINKIKYTELYKSVVARLEENNITIDQESKNMIKYKLSGILSNLKLTKFRSSDGIYWYGIRSKQKHPFRYT